MSLFPRSSRSASVDSAAPIVLPDFALAGSDDHIGYALALRNSERPLVEIRVSDGMIDHQSIALIREGQPRDGGGNYGGDFSCVWLPVDSAMRYVGMCAFEYGTATSETFIARQILRVQGVDSDGFWIPGNWLDVTNDPYARHRLVAVSISSLRPVDQHLRDWVARTTARQAPR